MRRSSPLLFCGPEDNKTAGEAVRLVRDFTGCYLMQFKEPFAIVAVKMGSGTVLHSQKSPASSGRGLRAKGY